MKNDRKGVNMKRLSGTQWVFNHNESMVLFLGSLAELSDKQG